MPSARRAAGGGGLNAIGYPTVTTASPRFIDDNAGESLLDGGLWKAGRLIREGVRFFLREITEKALASSNTAMAALSIALSDPHASLAAVASGDADPSP